ncbi:hypothetical protein [Chitinophaga defluvii]|uniref:Uncharacterized protein n=1 Tax=Chitinophaga defluvii TaxID=3163343 RepID=A0ABV2T3Y4_9BACT
MNRSSFKHLLFPIAVLLLALTQPSTAQDFNEFTFASNKPLKEAYDYAVSLYEASTGIQKGLNNGTQYAPYPYHLEGHAFFETAGWSPGSICYEGMLYKDVKLLYDLITGEVIVPYKDTYMQLHQDRINKFTINQHQFIRIAPDSASALGLSPGFYEQLYNNQLKVLARYSKNVQEEEIMNEKQYVVYSKRWYYLKIGDKYHQADNERMVLNLLKDKDKDIAQFIKKNKLSFKSNKELALTRIAAYYEQLKN